MTKGCRASAGHGARRRADIVLTSGGRYGNGAIVRWQDEIPAPMRAGPEWLGRSAPPKGTPVTFFDSSVAESGGRTLEVRAGPHVMHDSAQPVASAIPDVTTSEMSPSQPTAGSPVPESPAPPPAGVDVGVKEIARLDGHLIRGAAWTGSVKWLSQPFAWISTLIVARILSPTDYGILGMATFYLGFVKMVSEFGIGAAIVSIRDVSDEQIAQLNGLSLIVGVLTFVASCLIAWPLGMFFRAPQLPPVVIALSAAYALAALQSVPLAVLRRDLRFRRVALIDATQAMVTSMSAILFAWLGFRYWSLVLCTVTGVITMTALVLVGAPRSYRWPRRKSLGKILSFSRDMLVTRMAWYFGQDADFFVAGRVLGKAPLGFYSFGWTLANVAVEKITAMVLGVTPSVLARVQHDHAALRRYVLNISESLALITFPVTIGLALVADDVVHLALGDKWAGTATPLRLLAISAAVRSVTPILGQLPAVLDETRFQMRLNIVSTVLLPLGFLAGSHWGIVGIAASWLVVQPLVVLLPLTHRMFRRIGMRYGEYFRCFSASLGATLTMCVAVLGARIAIGDEVPRIWRLVACVLVGALAYGGFLFVLHRDRLGQYITRIRSSVAGSAT